MPTVTIHATTYYFSTSDTDPIPSISFPHTDLIPIISYFPLPLSLAIALTFCISTQGESGRGWQGAQEKCSFARFLLKKGRGWQRWVAAQSNERSVC
jgi:hypothetical protein